MLLVYLIENWRSVLLALLAFGSGFYLATCQNRNVASVEVQATITAAATASAIIKKETKQEQVTVVRLKHKVKASPSEIDKAECPEVEVEVHQAESSAVEARSEAAGKVESSSIVNNSSRGVNADAIKQTKQASRFSLQVQLGVPVTLEHLPTKEDLEVRAVLHYSVLGPIGMVLQVSSPTQQWKPYAFAGIGFSLEF